MKKSVVMAHSMLSNTYAEVCSSKLTCSECFSSFKNTYFSSEGSHSGGRDKVFKDTEVEALLNEQSDRTLKQQNIITEYDTKC